MRQKTLAIWLKIIIIGVSLSCAAIYAWAIPSLGMTIIEAEGQEYESFFWPWLIFLIGTAVPICIAMVLAWNIAENIGKDKSFSIANAKLLKWIAILAGIDCAYFFTGNIVLLFLNMNHPGVLLLSMIVLFVGAAVAVAAAALSHLVRKAAELQEQSDLTI